MTTTNTDVVSMEQAIQFRDNETEPDLVQFADLLDGSSYAAVDNSGSTGGEPLRVAKSFVNAIGVRNVSLWNTHCSVPVPAPQVHWESTGLTSPHTIFEPTNHVPRNASCFIFMTDGMIHSTARLARHASVTAHLPSLLVLFGPKPDPSAWVNHYNVSVVMAHFTAASTAAVIVINSKNDPSAFLIAAKGDWELALPSCPPLDDTLRLGQCPRVSVRDLRRLPSRSYQATATGSLFLSNDKILQPDALLLLEDGSALLSQLSEKELENIARVYLARGQLQAWRQRLNQWLIVVNQIASEEAATATRQASSGIHSMLRQLEDAVSSNERDVIRSEIQRVIFEGTTRAQEAEAQAATTARSPRAAINIALTAVTALEQSGMNATSLGRLSNRASRANTVNQESMAKLASLNVEDAPQTEDLVMHDIGPVALCLRAMDHPDLNTGDEALNQALRVGHFQQNAVFEPTIVALDIADSIEAMDTSPLTRQRLSVCLPIVSLKDKANRRAVFQRLCLVFMDGLSMQHAWLIALSSILRTIELHQWADPETTEAGRLLSWFAGQIMVHVTLPSGSRLSPNITQPIDAAFVSILSDETLLVHTSVEETSIILRLLHRFGGPATLSNDILRRSMQARIAISIPQTHRSWLVTNSASPWRDQGPGSLAALLSAVFQTRVSESGAHVPVAGTGRVVERMEGLLFESALQAVRTFARMTGTAIDDLLAPGATLVVLGTVDRVTSPHVSSTAAVREVQSISPSISAEMNPISVGTTTVTTVLDSVRRRLAWARTPLQCLAPFANPYGPSVFWFYAPDGSVINLMVGFGNMERRASYWDNLSQLTEHVRARRGELMARFYGTQESGSFAPRTTTVPLHREMANEYWSYRAMSSSTDLSNPEEASSFITRVVRRIVTRRGIPAGNVHSVHLERKVALLLPSLLSSVKKFPNLREEYGLRGGVSLARRVELELQSRTVEEVIHSEPPHPIWAMDNPEILRTLALVQQEQERARAAALRRRLAGETAPLSDVGPAVQQDRELRESDLSRFQRSMTWYLRHGAESNVVRPDGFVAVSTLLRDIAVNRFSGATVDHVLQIVETDEKGRFSIREENEGTLLIRANQGHTISVVDPEQLMTLIQTPEDVPVCLHGTYRDAFQNILRSGGLHRMQRHAIQMAVGMPDDPEVRSGIRKSVDVVISIDVEKATRVHGLQFYRSENNVICCVGPIPTDCFAYVVDLSDGSLLEY